MKKYVIMLVCAFGLSLTAFAQQNSTCEFLKENNIASPSDYFKDLKSSLQQQLPYLKTTRQWARNNNRADVELASNRLEYWAKKMIQAIDQNNPKNIATLCEKFQKEREYMSDFAQLTVFFLFSNGASVAKVDYAKYK